MYKYVIDRNKKVIILDKDGWRYSFLEDPANTDYQEYLKWIAEGNVAEEWSAE